MFSLPNKQRNFKVVPLISQHLVLHKEHRRHTLKIVSTSPDSVCMSYDYILTKN